MAEGVVLWVGTVKGLFGFESDASRREWRIAPPVLPEWRIDAVLADPADPDRLLVGTSHQAWGATVRETRDGGGTWTETPLRAPDDPAKYPLNRVWQLVRDPEGKIYAGVDEAALYVSEDDGATWREVDGLTSHPSRPDWKPGAGGLCLHSILVDPRDPRRVWVGISAVGVFGTTDGGATWTALNAGLPPMVATGSPAEDAIYCIHKILLDPEVPERLYMQFHAHTFTPDGTRSSGVFRSDDGGALWEPIDGALPLKFGFPMVRTADGALFVAPLTSDENRVFEDGVPQVWRSTDGGAAWRRLDLGSDGEPVFAGVLRDAMAVDGRAPAGVYLGTTGGDVYASPDAGESWARLPARLPRVLCVRAAGG